MMYKNQLQTELVVTPYLTETDSFYIMTDQNEDNNGLLYIERRPFTIEGDREISVEGYNFYGSTRFTHWVNDWRSIFGSPGA